MSCGKTITLLFFLTQLRLHYAGIINCSARSGVVDENSNVSDVPVKQIFDAIEAIRSNKKRPDCVSIQNYIAHHNTTYSEQKAIQEAI